MDYERSKQLLLADIESLPKSDGVIFYWGGKAQSPDELAEEIRNETEFGRHMITLHAKTVEKIKEIKAKQPPKKWWQFWK